MCAKKTSQRKSQEERREETRAKILRAAAELFFEKGYDKTTTRDIILRAGILNGSLYNRFKSKEEILLSLVSEGIGEHLEGCGELFGKGKDPLVAFVMPGAYEVYISSRSEKAADMFYAAHRSWAAVSSFADHYLRWAASLIESTGAIPLDSDVLRVKVIALLGAVGNIAAMYASGMKMSFEAVLADLIKMVSTAIDLPVFDVNGAVKKIVGIISGKEIVVFGHPLSEFEDYRP